ncbi:hypothetical protein [Subtercola boreus]|uniref:hypothetical protein n=1 Tax=Subtercola boreus TaxID=120213 RepID=UPI0011C041F6|nr:hypothetical protein [Subtercola boreus]
MVNADQVGLAEAVNPALPELGNMLWIVSVALILTLIVAALSTIWTSKNQGLLSRVLWTGLVALVPVIGSVAWFIYRGSRSRPAVASTNRF